MSHKNELIVNERKEIFTPDKTLSWAKIVDKYLSEIDLRPSTLDSYRRRLKRFVLYLSDNNITDPTPADLVNYKKYILENCKSILTCCNYLTSLRSLLKWTHRRGIYKNVIEGEVRNPPKPIGFMKDPVDLAQIKELLQSIERNSVKGKRDYCLCKTLAFTGARGCEIARANIKNIRKINGRYLLYLVGKGRDVADTFVVLVPSVVDAIDDYLLHRNYKSKEEPLFASTSTNYNGRLSTKSIRKIVKTRLRSIGIDNRRISCHSFRHGAITLSLLGGCSLNEAMKMARHQSINSTLIYNHSLELSENPAFKTIENLIED